MGRGPQRHLDHHPGRHRAHWDGISWSATSQRTPDLSIVAANSLGQVWALGKQWDALRSQGDAVTPLNLSGIPDGQPRTVWVSDEGEASLGINTIYNGQSELFGISVDGKVRRIASVSGSVSRIFGLRAEPADVGYEVFAIGS